MLSSLVETSFHFQLPENDSTPYVVWLHSMECEWGCGNRVGAWVRISEDTSIQQLQTGLADVFDAKRGRPDLGAINTV